MSARALQAAGISDPELRASYERCRKLHAAHGRTYYLATQLLPPAKRPHVWALYGFARAADEYVDSLDSPDPHGLLRWGNDILDGLHSGQSHDDIGAALVHTTRTWNLPTAWFEAFLGSMAMDITVREYPTYADLEHYMYGSAAVIGLQMVPILEPVGVSSSARRAPAGAVGGPGAPLSETSPAMRRAKALGEAFQLTNFLRDVREDCLRGRVYLPMEDLDRFGVRRADLEQGRLTLQVRDLFAFECARTRALYDQAEPGIDALHPTSRDCVRTAFELYRGILDNIEAANYDVFTRRITVPVRQRLRVALPAWRRAVRARRAVPSGGAIPIDTHGDSHGGPTTPTT